MEDAIDRSKLRKIINNGYGGEWVNVIFSGTGSPQLSWMKGH